MPDSWPLVALGLFCQLIIPIFSIGGEPDRSDGVGSRLAREIDGTGIPKVQKPSLGRPRTLYVDL